MIRASAFLFVMFAVGGAIAIGCGSDPSVAPASASDAGPDSGDVAPGPDGSTETPEAGCAHRGDVDAGANVVVDGGTAALAFFDIGGLDRQISLSSDGKTALFQDGMNGDVYLYETATGTLSKKTTTGDPQLTLSTALSGDGQFISSFHGKDTVVAGRWDSCNGWIDATISADGCIGDPQSGNPNTDSLAFDVNYDGTVLVGATWNKCATISAARWTLSGTTWTPQALEHKGIVGGNNRATVVSDDGKIVGGFSQSEAADRVPTIWGADGKGTVLDPAGTTVGEVLSISHDGKMVAGAWNFETNGGFYWTEADGVVRIDMFPEAAGQDQMWLNAVAGENNRLLFGSAGDPSFFSGGLGSMQQAVVWTKADGLRKLQDVIAEKGVTLPADWYLVNVMAASADGGVLIGFAADMGKPFPEFHSFVLKLDPSSY